MYAPRLAWLTLYGSATLLGAALMFLAEPMAAKALLPLLGGSAGVWTASLVFYQGVLLAAYAYAHLLVRRLSPRAMALLHAGTIVLAALLLPWHGPGAAGPGEMAPALWVLGALAGSVGLPFFVLAATGPLLQRWFAARRIAGEPYWLYAVSNASSLAALLAYPWLVERHLPLAASAGAPHPGPGLTQNVAWSSGFLLFAALALGCAASVALSSQGAMPHAAVRSVPWRRRLAWAATSFVPAAAMLGTTQALATDVASVPLLWVLPLAIYLVTFVAAFAAPRRVPVRFVSGAVGLLVLGIAASQWIAPRSDPRVALPLYLGALFAIGALCHGRLADERPPAADLTDFYLAIAAGGALGSLASGLVAPLVFRSIAEYPLVLVLACLLRPGKWPRWRRDALVDVLMPLALAALVGLVHASNSPTGERSAEPSTTEVLVASVACALLMLRPLAFALGVAVLFLAGAFLNPLAGHDLQVERTFFGVLRVKDVGGPAFQPQSGPNAGKEVRLPLHELYHGTTLHGVQVARDTQARLPTAYYHPSGPIGRVFAGLRAGRERAGLGEVGVVGLGVGSLAAYAEPGEHFTFFEIDPAVVRIARDPALFTYLRDCAGNVDVVVADGRVALAAQPDGRFGLLVIDAFSSDAVPVHLLTREALELALRKLGPGGVVAYHLSSNFFDLAAVVAEGAASLGKEGLYWDDEAVTPVAVVTAKQPSRWAVIAAERTDLAPLAATGAWVSLDSRRRQTGGPWLWTDRYSSPLAALGR